MASRPIVSPGPPIHANYVNPYWASSGMITARIGAHLFYRMPGDGGPGASGGSLNSVSSIFKRNSYNAFNY